MIIIVIIMKTIIIVIITLPDPPPCLPGSDALKSKRRCMRVLEAVAM